MRRWLIELESGRSLKKAIKTAAFATSDVTEKQAKVLNALEESVSECVEMLPEHMTIDFEDFQRLIDGEADLIRTRDPLIREMGFKNATELIDGRLDQFYDLCDQYKVWVGFVSTEGDSTLRGR